MTKWTDPKRICESLKPTPGYFAVEKEGESLKWENCRERFFNTFTSDLPGFFFSHEFGECENIAAFIDKTEEILEVEKSDFAKTNRPYAIWVSPSKFWRPCEIRRSLFTILLRAGRKYNISANNYEDALFGQEYVKLTKDAVMRFMFGFHSYIPQDNSKGWVNAFMHKKCEDVRKRLVSTKPEKFSLIGTGSLWV